MAVCMAVRFRHAAENSKRLASCGESCEPIIPLVEMSIKKATEKTQPPLNLKRHFSESVWRRHATHALLVYVAA